MKKQLLLLAMILLPMVASADAVEIDGIFYNLNSKNKEATVTSHPNYYGGSVVIPESVTYEGKNFKVTSIGYGAFSHGELVSITIPNSITAISINAFQYCSSLTAVNISDVAAWCNIDFGGSSANPLTYARYFYLNGEEIIDLVIPNSVTSIRKYAFVNYDNLTSVTLGNSVTSIGSNAFQYCSSLASVTIGNSVTSIEKGAFYGCSRLTSVTIPNSVTNIGESAFQYSRLTSVTIGNSVKSIGKGAFYGCSHLTSVTIPNSVTNIGNEVFSGCSSLNSVTIGNSVKIIGKGLFYNCSSLTSVTIGNSVTSIGEHAFYGCSDLPSVTIPNNITSIYSNAFKDCSKLTSINISDVAAWCNIMFADSGANPLFYAHHLFVNGEEIKDLVIPNSVTSIGDYAFQNCSNLTSVTIPNSVMSIEKYAFAYCSSLSTVTIGSGINTISAQAFRSCQEFTDVYCYAINVPNTNNGAFRDAYIEYSTLHVPAESVDAYKAAEPWKNFNEIVALTDDDPKPDATGINVVRNTEGNKSVIYDLNGVRQPEPKKGINIINGKKVVVK